MKSIICILMILLVGMFSTQSSAQPPVEDYVPLTGFFGTDILIPLESCMDNDGDSYDDEACGGDDCDDTDPNVNPGMEDCGNINPNGIDDDCDGQVDENCGSNIAFGPHSNARILGFFALILIPMIFVLVWRRFALKR